MATHSKTAQPSPGTVNLARAFHEHVESLQTFARTGRIKPRNMNVETLENLLQLTDNAGHILRGLINGCRPINRLPSEILATIFSFVPQAHPLAPRLATFSSHKMFQVTDLLPITFTCRRWRAVALGTSSLWSTIVAIKSHSEDGRHPLRTPYLDRCPAGPLRFLLTRPCPEQTLSVFAEQSSRVSELVALSLDSSAVATIASAPMSTLQYCSIGYCQLQTPTVALFPGCPSLRTLSLDAVNFMPSTDFPSLTQLHVTHPSLFVGTGYSPRDFFTFLSGCPNLQTLFFEVPQERFMDIPFSDINFTVPLEHLERLVIIERHFPDFAPGTVDGRMAFLRAFFAHVSIPSSCVVRLGDIPLSDLPHCTDVFGFTDNHTSWRIYKGEHAAYNPMYTELVSIQVFSPMDGRYLWLDVITSPLDPGALDEDIVELSTALAQLPVFTNARDVWIDPGCASLLSTGWDPLLSHMPHLESLAVCRNSDELEGLRESNILRVLEPTNSRSLLEDADPRWEEAVMACPRLTTLRVDCLTDEDAVYVLQVAAARAAAGFPFTRVTLGRVFRRRVKVCMLHHYDGSGEVIKVGSAVSDVLWEHWMAQLSPICLDESQDCEPYWKSWRWNSLPPRGW